MSLKEKLNVPNAISFYRLLAFPVILYFALTGKETLFAIFIVINLLTDILDGFIARLFNMETEFGARLDSIADNLTYILAFIGVFVFKLDDIFPHLNSFLIFVGFLLLQIFLPLIKFGRFSSFHLYSTRIGGYIQGAFFISLFTIGFITPFYYFMVTWSILSCLEHIIIQLILPEMRSNVKGLYWVLKEKRQEKRQEKILKR